MTKSVIIKKELNSQGEPIEGEEEPAAPPPGGDGSGTGSGTPRSGPPAGQANIESPLPSQESVADSDSMFLRGGAKKDATAAPPSSVEMFDGMIEKEVAGKEELKDLAWKAFREENEGADDEAFGYWYSSFFT